MRNRVKIICYLVVFLITVFTINSCIYFGFVNVPNEKWLMFENDEYNTKVIIIYNNNDKWEDNVEPGRGIGSSGDFRLIYIEAENGVEGVFRINNLFTKKYMSRMEYMEKTVESKYNNENLNDPFQVRIKITDNMFEIEYYDDIFSIDKIYSYEQDFLQKKKEYLKGYNID